MFSLDGQLKSGTVVTSGGFLTTTANLAQGSHTLSVTVANQASLSTSKSWSFSVDSLAPSLAVTVPQTSSLRFPVAWSGTDGGSGVKDYTVKYSTAGASGPWQGWLTNTSVLSASFTGVSGTSYHFQVSVRDKALNQTTQVKGPVVVNGVTKYYLLGSQWVAMRQRSAVYFLHGNHLGSTSLTTDQSGVKFSESRYLPYGEDSELTTTPSPTDFGFTGQRKIDPAEIRISQCFTGSDEDLGISPLRCEMTG